jgi:hypothetical protein
MTILFGILWAIVVAFMVDLLTKVQLGYMLLAYGLFATTICYRLLNIPLSQSVRFAHLVLITGIGLTLAYFSRGAWPMAISKLVTMANVGHLSKLALQFVCQGLMLSVFVLGGLVALRAMAELFLWCTSQVEKPKATTR